MGPGETIPEKTSKRFITGRATLKKDQKESRPNEISTFVSLAGGDGRGADLVVQEGAAMSDLCFVLAIGVGLFSGFGIICVGMLHRIADALEKIVKTKHV
ncbi:MAG: hypothetical protein ACLPLR_06110 [Terriglobales bacterium]